MTVCQTEGTGEVGLGKLHEVPQGQAQASTPVQNNLHYQYRLGYDEVENSHAVKDLRTLVDKNLKNNMHVQPRTIASWAATKQAQPANWEVILSLCPALVRSHLEYHVLHTRRIWTWCKGSKERSWKWSRWLEHLFHEETLREFRFFSLEKRRLQRDFIVAFQYLKRPHKKAGEGLLIKASSNRIRGNDFKLEKGRFRLDILWRWWNTGTHYPGGSISGDIQCNSLGGSDQPDLVGDIPAYCRGVGIDGLKSSRYVHFFE